MLITEGPFAGLRRNHYGAVLADPPWTFEYWGKFRGQRDGRIKSDRSASYHYDTMEYDELAKLSVTELAMKDCVLFIWTTWPQLPESLALIERWGFEYKTCAFCWTKAHAGQLEMFQDDINPYIGLGYWTRTNSEPCLLATRGNPKRLNADVRQAIIAPRREHSRKPDGIHERIQRLVAGPYLELFARQCRPGWDCWGNEVDKFREAAE